MRPQLRYFGRYVTGLMVCTNRTVQGINDIFLGHPEQGTLNHLTDFPWDNEEFSRVRYGFVKARLEELGLGDDILVLDAPCFESSPRRLVLTCPLLTIVA